MSRPIVRIAISAVIAFALVAGIYTSVQGALMKGDTARSGAAADHHGLSRNRPTIDGPSNLAQPPAQTSEKEGGCHQEAQIDPYD
jgi:hypothetical protein